MVDIGKLSGTLEQKESGIWFSKTEASVHYPEQGNEWCQQIEDDSFWFLHRNDCIAAVVQQYVPPGPFFDVGGGNGFVALALQKAGYDAVVVEPGWSGAGCAKKRGIDTVVCSSIEAAGFAENSLHAVGLFDVIEHVPDDLQFLRTLWGLLGEEGKIVVTAPAYQFLWSTDDDLACHFRRYSMQSLLSRLAQSGFQPEYHSYLFSFLPVPVFLGRALPSRFGFRKGLRLDQERREHKCPGKVSGAAVGWLMSKELQILKQKGRLPFGGSCLVIAKKVADKGSTS